MTKCETCMQSQSLQARQMHGCPWAPIAPERLAPYVQPWNGLGYAGDKPTACPGYTTNLPEVVEVARARLHWSKGQITAFCGGEQPTDALMIGVEILEGAIGEVITWSSTPRDKGGGGA